MTGARRAVLAAALGAVAAAAVLVAIVGREGEGEDAGAGRRTARLAVRMPAREPPTLDALREAIERVRTQIAAAADPRAAAEAAIDDWAVPAGAWPALVTERFRPRHDAYLKELAWARRHLVDELVALGAPADPSSAPPISVRWQYADDPALSPEQRRLRVALPVGRPGAIVFAGDRPLSPIFAHDGARWRVLAGLDLFVVRHLVLAHPECLAPYRAAAREPCLAMTAPIIAAALDEDDLALERACRRLVLQCPVVEAAP